MQVTIVSSACVLCLIAYLFLSNRSVYLVNFSCYKPPAACAPSFSATVLTRHDAVCSHMYMHAEISEKGSEPEHDGAIAL